MPNDNIFRFSKLNLIYILYDFEISLEIQKVLEIYSNYKKYKSFV